MDLLQFFKQVVDSLKEGGLRYALAGGLIASVYRLERRLTMDLDFLILADSKTQEIATQIIKSFELNPSIIRKADLEGGPLFVRKRRSTKPIMVAGRAKNDPTKIGLDFILPQMPWFEEALERAQSNEIDFGFGPVPSLTVEDVIVSKLLAVKNNVTRFKDLDDLQSIFQAEHDLDLAYLYAQMKKIDVGIPKQIKHLVPKVILAAGRKLGK